MSTTSLKSIEAQYDTLVNQSTEYGDQQYLVGDFKENGEKVNVQTWKNGFEVSTGVDQSPDEVLEEFIKFVPERGEIYGLKENNEVVEIDTAETNLDGFEQVRYLGDTYGFKLSQNNGHDLSGEYELAVFSNENMEYIADSARAIPEVFPELKDLEENSQMLDEAFDMAVIDLGRYADIESF